MIINGLRRIIRFMRRIMPWIAVAITLLNALEDPMWLAFSLWLLVYLLRARLRRWIDHWSIPNAYIALGVTFGLLVESFAILDNLDLPPDERILLNPNPIADLIMGAVYYTFVIVTWYLLLRRIAYTSRQVFLITGVFGIVVEQSGAILLGIIGSPIIGGLLALLVMCIYGMFPQMAYWLTVHQFSTERKPVTRRYMGLALVALFVQYALYGLFIFPTLTVLFGD
ncbi:MAG: hypothetical protein JXA10_02240 [Anaerolineae bacterium]|nr:hypothetical protein [Anaerolineae bacterium]